MAAKSKKGTLSAKDAGKDIYFAYYVIDEDGDFVTEEDSETDAVAEAKLLAEDAVNESCKEYTVAVYKLVKVVRSTYNKVSTETVAV